MPQQLESKDLSLHTYFFFYTHTILNTAWALVKLQSTKEEKENNSTQKPKNSNGKITDD